MPIFWSNTHFSATHRDGDHKGRPYESRKTRINPQIPTQNRAKKTFFDEMKKNFAIPFVF
jgi:hypothetical protein